MYLPWLILLAAPVAAVVICSACRNHRTLLWLGCLLTAGMGFLVLWGYPSPQHQKAHAVIMGWFMLSVILPLLAAGIILLVGGLVRWGLAWWGWRGGAAADRPQE